MAKRTKMPTDLNQRAKAIVDLATSDEAMPDKGNGLNSVASARKGGDVRAENLTPERRSEIARAAAKARWERG